MPFGRRRMSDVSLPSSKIQMFDEIARHGGRPAYYAYTDTSQPMLFFDSSVRSTRTISFRSPITSDSCAIRSATSCWLARSASSGPSTQSG